MEYLTVSCNTSRKVSGVVCSITNYRDPIYPKIFYRLTHYKLESLSSVDNYNQTTYFNLEEINKLSGRWHKHNTMNSIPMLYGTFNRDAYSAEKEIQMGLSEWIWKEITHGCNSTEINQLRCDLFGHPLLSTCTMQIKELAKDVQLLTPSIGKSANKSVYTSGQHILAAAHCANGTLQVGLQCLKIISSQSVQRDVELSALLTKQSLDKVCNVYARGRVFVLTAMNNEDQTLTAILHRQNLEREIIILVDQFKTVVQYDAHGITAISPPPWQCFIFYCLLHRPSSNNLSCWL